MRKPEIVGHQAWLEARKAFLAKEKEFTRLRDEVSRARQALPWEKVETGYVFDGPDGRETLSDLFEGRSQLLVYHFMFGPGWGEGCPSCSYLADHFDPAIVHLNQRDVTLVVVSRAPRAEFEPFKTRMGWNFKWVSSAGSNFNRDYGVSFTEEEAENGTAEYNYTPQTFPTTEAPGLSVFYKDEDGAIYHTYSAYSRGLDILIPPYNFLDMAPKGRDEQDLPWSMAWVRYHDSYGD